MRIRASVLTMVHGLIFLFGLSLPAHAGGGGLLVKALSSLGDSIGEALESEVEELGEEILDTARVDAVDTSIRPSVVVRTDDGTIFQLRNLSFVSMRWLDRVLEKIERIDLEQVGDDRFRLEIVYANRGTGGMLKKVAFGTAKRLVANRIGEEAVPLPGLLGTSLDGSAWAMVPSNHGLASIEFLHAGGEL